jgi:Organic solute transporter Ostalpha
LERYASGAPPVTYLPTPSPHPAPLQFLCIKGVIFFTWWQSVIIFYLRAHGIIGNVGDWTSRDVAYGLIDYCIVLEMVGFAIAHSYTFAYTEYLPGSVPTPEMICQQQQQQQQQQQNEALAGGEGSEGEQCADNPRLRNPSLHNRNVASYRPPATLDQPMKFRDALWSSTMPRETLQDIQRLRTGFDSALQEVRRDAGISLPEVAIRSDLQLHDDDDDEAEGANEDAVRHDDRDDDHEDGPAVPFV